MLKKTANSNHIEEKIVWARCCFIQLREILLEDKTVSRLTTELLSAIESSRTKMRLAGIMDLCRQCEEEEGGSCCGAGMEERYDPHILVINLLLGCTLPEKREYPDSCFFLGKKGCTLKARHVICVNYLCKKIENSVNPNMISKLRQAEGKELNILFVLHEYIKRLLPQYNKKNHHLIQNPK